MADLKLRPWTAADAFALIASRSQWQPGDRIQPLTGPEVDGFRERETLTVTERIDTGEYVRYLARRDDGTEIEVYVSDDPRAAD